MKVALVKVAFVPWMFVAISSASVVLQVKAAEDERLVPDVQKATRVFAPEPVRLLPPTQVLPIAKQPVVSEMPFCAVLVAAPERLICVAESPAANVLVPCPAPTVIPPANVEVAVPETIKLLARMLPAFSCPT